MSKNKIENVFEIGNDGAIIQLRDFDKDKIKEFREGLRRMFPKKKFLIFSR